MCSIWYINAVDEEKIHDAVELQIDRWLDSMGIVTENSYMKFVPTKSLSQQDAISYYSKTTSFYLTNEWINTWVLWHIRKTSVGKMNIDNSHPVKMNSYMSIIQNWTNKWILDWAKYEFWDKFDSHRNDTYYLWQRILKRTNSLKSMPKYFDQIESQLGIIFIVNYRTKEILLYSDWARECYVDMSEDWKTVNRILNYKPWDKNRVEHYFRWCIIFKITDWSVIKYDWISTEKEKYTFKGPTVQPTLIWWHNNSTTANWYKNDNDACYDYSYRRTDWTVTNNPSSEPGDKEFSKQKFKKLRKFVPGITKEQAKELVHDYGMKSLGIFVLKTLEFWKTYDWVMDVCHLLICSDYFIEIYECMTTVWMSMEDKLNDIARVFWDYCTSEVENPIQMEFYISLPDLNPVIKTELEFVYDQLMIEYWLEIEDAQWYTQDPEAVQATA